MSQHAASTRDGYNPRIALMLARGTRLGPYEILSPLGSGGMGEVYRARDMKLSRDVALKILPDLFAADSDRLARFKREAQVLASLNQPNIGAIYGFEESDGVQALVLELVDGPTLANRIAQGPIPLDEALPIARQIAEALEAAHELGIVHRDLKPANIKLRPDGTVKVLDFGLAKAREPTSSIHGDVTASPTITTPAMTAMGVILGTAAYMSPEQARGKAVDKRSDIWAFGCVLYEMLTGRRAFSSTDLSDTLAFVMTREPDWTALPGATPASIQRLLRRCLEKDRKRRLPDIADARLEIDDAPQTPVRAAESVAVAATAGPLMTLVSAVLLVAAGAAFVALYLRRTPDLAPATRLSISAPGHITPQTSVAISPDGRRVAFVSTDASGRSMLWIRELDSLEPRVLAGTEDAAHPFWAPDGTSLGFLAGGKLKRVDAAGGGVLTLADVTTRNGASWSRHDLILFVPRMGELATVPATGGPVSKVLARGNGGLAWWPFFLPDGRHFLFVDPSGREEARGVYVGSLDSKETRHLLTTDFKAMYADPGYLLFVRGEALLAQRLDPERLQLSGEPAVVAEGIWVARSAAQASFSVSPAHALAYVNATLWNSQLNWVDRTGRPLGALGPPDRYFDQVPQIAPDGSRVAIARGFESPDVWVTSVTGGTTTRLTFEPGSSEPVWSSDGRRILFQSVHPGGFGLRLKDSGGVGSEEAVGTISGNGHLWDWSRDGRFIVYSKVGEQGAADLWVLSLAEKGKPFPFDQSVFNKTQAQIAPNGRWIAYTSYESGRDEVYVQSFPEPGSRRQISAAGGMQPRWRRDGAELFYLGSDQNLIAVPVRTGGAFEAGRPRSLFRSRILPQGSQSIWFDTAYDVTPDGQRFLVMGPPEDPGPPVTVVLNWLGALRK